MAEDEKVKTVLIIEDDTVLGKMYEQKLSSEGYNVLMAYDGEGGLEIAKKQDIDLVLTDIMLPRMSGLEFITAIGKISKKKNVPIVAWSNLADESDKEAALKGGAKEYLVKGKVKLDDIVGIVSKYIG